MALLDGLMPWLQEEEIRKQQNYSGGAVPGPSPISKEDLLGQGQAPTTAPPPDVPAPQSNANLILDKLSGRAPYHELYQNPAPAEERLADPAAPGIGPRIQAGPQTPGTERPQPGYKYNVYKESQLYKDKSQELAHGLTPEKHKGPKGRFLHGLEGLGLGAMGAVNRAYAGGARSWDDLLGAAIGGGGVGAISGGVKPLSIDKLHDEMILRPQFEKEQEREWVAQKIYNEQEKTRLEGVKTGAEVKRIEAETTAIPQRVGIQKTDAETRAKSAQDLAANRTANLELNRNKYSQPNWRPVNAKIPGLFYDTKTAAQTGTPIPGNFGGTGTGSGSGATNLSPGSAGLTRLREQIKNQIISDPQWGTVDSRTAENVAHDPGGPERMLATTMGYGWTGAQALVHERNAYRANRSPSKPVATPTSQLSDADKQKALAADQAALEAYRKDPNYSHIRELENSIMPGDKERAHQMLQDMEKAYATAMEAHKADRKIDVEKRLEAEVDTRLKAFIASGGTPPAAPTATAPAPAAAPPAAPATGSPAPTAPAPATPAPATRSGASLPSAPINIHSLRKKPKKKTT